MCLYLLPLSAILMYHVFAIDTQLYISFKCKQPLEVISNKRGGVMITNKFKINYSKTEFIVFRSPQIKCD